MVVMLASNPIEPRLPIIFNVEGAVGAAPATNNPDDVMLVKAFLRRLGVSHGPRIDAATEAALKAVTLDASPDASLVAAIKAYQLNLKKNRPAVVADGRVSPASGGYHYSETTVWSIVQLNFDMKGDPVFNRFWPCIHLATICPPNVKAIVKKAIYGTD